MCLIIHLFKLQKAPVLYNDPKVAQIFRISLYFQICHNFKIALFFQEQKNNLCLSYSLIKRRKQNIDFNGHWL